MQGVKGDRTLAEALSRNKNSGIYYCFLVSEKWRLYVFLLLQVSNTVAPLPAKLLAVLLL